VFLEGDGWTEIGNENDKGDRDDAWQECFKGNEPMDEEL